MSWTDNRSVWTLNKAAQLAAYDPVLSTTCPGDSITKLLIAELGPRGG